MSSSTAPTGPITYYSPTTTTNAYGTAKANGNVLTQNDFLNLLSKQLQNQDPTNPQSNTDFAAQMAQFSSLSEMGNLTTTMNNFVGLDQLSSGSSLIGKTVTTDLADSTGNLLSGKVASVSIQNGTMMLSVGGQQVKYSDITGIQPASS